MRHEYLGGMVYAMVGAIRRHNRIALNIAARLLAAARGGPCRVNVEAFKLRAEVIYYPGVMVARGTGDDDPPIEDAPCLVVEVASPSTESIDRRERMLAYRSVPSLRAYLNRRPARPPRRALPARRGWRVALGRSRGRGQQGARPPAR